jgi:hypothetical protein
MIVCSGDNGNTGPLQHSGAGRRACENEIAPRAFRLTLLVGKNALKVTEHNIIRGKGITHSNERVDCIIQQESLPDAPPQIDVANGKEPHRPLPGLKTPAACNHG